LRTTVEESAFEGFDVKLVEESVDTLEGVAGDTRLLVGTEWSGSQ